MTSWLKKLLEISSDSISTKEPVIKIEIVGTSKELFQQLINILKKKNGFLVFESALRFFPADPTLAKREITRWNNPDVWIGFFDGMAAGAIFFAEDVFGSQFCIVGDEIRSFDPETGEMEFISYSFEDWAKEILEDYEALTGYPIAHEWQETYGVLDYDKVLAPKYPFVLGGEFELNNMSSMDAVKAMLFRADLAKQIRDLPDGAEIEFVVKE